MQFMTKITYMGFYVRVKQLAKKSKNLSLQEFIFSVGLNHASYYSLQRAGNLPRADEALIIAQALNTTVEYLLMGTEPEERVNIAIPFINRLLDYNHGLFSRYKKNGNQLP